MLQGFQRKPMFPLELERVLDMLYETTEVSRDYRPNSRGTLSLPPQVKKNPDFPASTRDDALFLCTDASGVPRGPSNSTIFLTSPKHPEKLPEVTVTCRGKPGFPHCNSRKTSIFPLQCILRPDSPAVNREQCPAPPQLEWRLKFPGATREVP